MKFIFILIISIFINLIKAEDSVCDLITPIVNINEDNGYNVLLSFEKPDNVQIGYTDIFWAINKDKESLSTSIEYKFRMDRIKKSFTHVLRPSELDPVIELSHNDIVRYFFRYWVSDGSDDEGVDCESNIMWFTKNHDEL